MPTSEQEFFNSVTEFVTVSNRAETLDALEDSFRHHVALLGFERFACCHHVQAETRATGPLLLLTDYPADWVGHYFDAGYNDVDPAFLRASRDVVPFSWSEAAPDGKLSRQQQKMMSEARGLGLTSGFTVPLHCNGLPPASCTFITDQQEIEEPVRGAAQLLAVYFYGAALNLVRERYEAEAETAHSLIPLTRRERECIELVGAGKTDWEIGSILSISENTVHAHIEKAKRKLGVTTRVQAVVWSLFAGLISFDRLSIPSHIDRPNGR